MLCNVTLHTNMHMCFCVYVQMPVLVLYIIRGGGGGGMGLLWTENIPPSYNLFDPAASLPTAIYFFLPLSHHRPHPQHTSTHTCSLSPFLPAPPPSPRLLWEEQRELKPARTGGGNQGRTCPGSAFWSSSRQGDRSTVTPALEETAPRVGPPWFALH